MSLYLRVRGSTSRRRDAWVRIREARCIASRRPLHRVNTAWPKKNTRLSSRRENAHALCCATDHHFVGAFLTFRLVKVVIRVTLVDAISLSTTTSSRSFPVLQFVLHLVRLRERGKKGRFYHYKNRFTA